MDKNSSTKDESVTPSLMDLLKKYTTRVDERATLWTEGTRACRQQQKVQTDQIDKLKETVNRLQSKSSLISEDNQQQPINEDTTNLNYKIKWEEAEVKYRRLEMKYDQLENGTMKQLQEKIDQLERDYHHMKIVKERISEICSCRQLTNIQIEQLKLLVNNTTHFSIEPIANKNDFHQQTIQLREILMTHNNELLNKLEEVIKKKRKRDQYEDHSSDDDSHH